MAETKPKPALWWRVAKALLWTVAGAMGGALAVALITRPSGPLERWHLEVPEGEFRAEDEGEGFEAYLAREARLFQGMGRYLVETGPGSGYNPYLRYARGGPNTPAAFARDYNRTWEIAPPSPRGAVLLLHGLSDSPYSLRAEGELLAARGYYVLALRLPGHGTVPAGLLKASWEDWAAAARLAARHAAGKAGGGPFLICGYSTGGALAVLYALEAQERGLPRPDGLLLFSPAVGVTPFARAARWNRLVDWIPGLDRLAWLELDPEIDPFKYGSFTNRAGAEIWELTRAVGSALSDRDPQGPPDPPVLTFESGVDATVLSPETGTVLHAQLRGSASELVVVDVNRPARLTGLVKAETSAWWQALAADADRTFRLTVLCNRGDSTEVEARSWGPGQTVPTVGPTGLSWPLGTFSLSHIAMPIPPDDPLYGDGPSPAPAGHLCFGAMASRGEFGVLNIPMEDQLRLRYNPFWADVAHRLEAFCEAREGEKRPVGTTTP